MGGKFVGLLTGYTGVLLFDVIVVCIRIFVLAFGIFCGMKKAKFAVSLIFWFELHARWLDWCQIVRFFFGIC